MKILYITHVANHVNRFWLTSIEASKKMDMEFHLACNYIGDDKEAWEKACYENGIAFHQIDFNRNPLSYKNITALKQLKNLLKKERFDIVHCNTPVGGLIGRLGSYKNVPYIIYQAHGFHFWKGAPLKNWLFYYPVEKKLSRITDTLITINLEDYNLAKKKMSAKKTVYVPGVGIDLQQFNITTPCSSLRRELGISDSDYVILSVGELIKRKNHELVIRSIKKLVEEDKTTNYKYLICGQGVEMNNLKSLIKETGLEKNVILLGFRSDIKDIYSITDLFAFMSLQEGLPVALMEAMASGVPVICSRIRGNTDLVENGVSGIVSSFDIDELCNGILTMRNDKHLSGIYAENARKKVEEFSNEAVAKDLAAIYAYDRY